MQTTQMNSVRSHSPQRNCTVPQLCILSISTALNMLLATVCIGGVTINQGGVGSYVIRQSSLASDDVNLTGTTDEAALATISESFFSSTSRAIDDTGISIGLVRSRDGGWGDHATGYAYAEFTIDVDTAYSVSGYFSSPRGYANLMGSLYDFSTGNFVFAQATAAYGPLDAHFGAYGGTTTIDGSLFGTLFAGHQYQFFVNATVSADPDADEGALAIGTARLQFSEISTEVIPEPASLAVWSCLGLTTIGATWWQRRRSP
jgi:hypothetical protein